MSLHNPPTICFFEDQSVSAFLPLTLTRPADDLRVGILTVREKWLLELAADYFFRIPSPELSNLFPADGSTPESGPYGGQPVAGQQVTGYSGQSASGSGRYNHHGTGPVYWINSRLLPDPMTIRQMKELSAGKSIEQDGKLLILKQSPGEGGEHLREVTGRNPGTEERKNQPEWLRESIAIENQTAPDGELRLLRHVWDLIHLNAGEIVHDLERLGARSVGRDSMHGVRFAGGQPIHVDESAVIEPGVTIIAEEGPVYIGPNTRVMAGSALRGPLAVCEGAQVKMGATIYGNTTIGPVCKVGGEVQNTLFHSYSNKGHDGFVGHSVIGQWCNLGAGTTTSNLKNNYRTVRMPSWRDDEQIETGQQFLGTIMGDHSRTGIQTMLPTGTLCGVSCNVFGSGFAPRKIPSFSWVDSGQFALYRFDKAIDTMRQVMKRRQRTLDEATSELMQRIFDDRNGGSGSSS